MATLDATVGGATSNSYTTVVDASDLLEARLSTDAWDDATPDDQAAALMWATSLMDQQVRWYGQPATTTQALAWPQTGQVDHLGHPVPSTALPPALPQATAVYALALLEETSATATGESDLAIKSRKLGDTMITYQDAPQTTTARRAPSQSLPAEVRALLRPYGTMSGGLTISLLRT